jgi:hypothetical protein
LQEKVTDLEDVIELEDADELEDVIELEDTVELWSLSTDQQLLIANRSSFIIFHNSSYFKLIYNQACITKIKNARNQ